VNRDEFRKLSEIRIEDAAALLAASRWSAAYYLSGYALETALKACVISRLERRPETVFEEKRFSEKCWTHDLQRLKELAELIDEWDDAVDQRPQLQQNWMVAKDWSELSRYRTWGQAEAERLFHAISDRTDGVLQWVQKHW